jgi:hypothetical protein
LLCFALKTSEKPSLIFYLFYSSVKRARTLRSGP